MEMKRGGGCRVWLEYPGQIGLCSGSDRRLAFMKILCRLTLRSPSCTSCIPPHGHRLLVFDHVAQVGQGAL